MEKQRILPSHVQLALAEELLAQLLEHGITDRDVRAVTEDRSGALAQSLVRAWRSIQLVQGQEPEDHLRARACLGRNFVGVGEVMRQIGPYLPGALERLLPLRLTDQLLEERIDWMLFPGASVSISQMEELEHSKIVSLTDEQLPQPKPLSRLKRVLSFFWEFDQAAVAGKKSTCFKRPNLELLCYRSDWVGPQGIYAQCVNVAWYFMPPHPWHQNVEGEQQMEKLIQEGLRPAYACEACYYLVLHYLLTGERLCSNMKIRTADRSGSSFIQVGPFTDKGIMFSRGWKADPRIGVMPVLQL